MWKQQVTHRGTQQSHSASQLAPPPTCPGGLIRSPNFGGEVSSRYLGVFGHKFINVHKTLVVYDTDARDMEWNRPREFFKYDAVGRSAPRPSTPDVHLRDLRRTVFANSQDYYTFRKVVGRHGALMASLGEIVHAATRDKEGAKSSQITLCHVYQELWKLNAVWIRVICAPDDSIYAGTESENKYRDTVTRVIENFTNRLVGMLTNEFDEDSAFDDAMGIQSKFFCTLSEKPDAYLMETNAQLRAYVNCLTRAWDTINTHGAGTNAHHVTSGDCIAAAMSLGAWLDFIIK